MAKIWGAVSYSPAFSLSPSHFRNLAKKTAGSSLGSCQESTVTQGHLSHSPPSPPKCLSPNTNGAETKDVLEFPSMKSVEPLGLLIFYVTLAIVPESHLYMIWDASMNEVSVWGRLTIHQKSINLLLNRAQSISKDYFPSVIC